MQTDRGIYHKRVCDRCGAVLTWTNIITKSTSCRSSYKTSFSPTIRKRGIG